jgi:type IV secretory pathway component VirB8
MSAVVHKARPLTVSERSATYADALSFYGERERMKRGFAKLGWVVGGVGMVAITASAIGWTIMLPLKSTELRFIVDNKATGDMTYTVRADEAEALFGTKEAEHFLAQYVENREGYVPETDKRHWDVIREMSSAEVFVEYTGWRKTDLSPVKQLGAAGHVKISDISFTPHGKGDNGTFEYTVRFRRQEVRDDTVGPVKPFSTVIDFQWHPKAAQTVQEGIDNPGGMVVVAYSVPRPD